MQVSRDLADRGSAEAREVAWFFEDALKILASDARIAVRRPTNLYHQLAGNPSRRCEGILESKKVPWRIETLMNHSDKIAVMMSLAVAQLSLSPRVICARISLLVGSCSL
jgi:hypothetical protein